MKKLEKQGRAARARAVRGQDPQWKQVKWRITRSRHAGGVIDRTAILHREGAGDLEWIYEFPDGKGTRDITAEFWYELAEPKIREIKDGKWRRIMGDMANRVPEQILPAADGAAASNFTTSDATDDLVEVFFPPRVLGPGGQSGIAGDLALDLKTGWGCRSQEDHIWALAEIKRRKPKVVGLTPPCQTFCALQNRGADKRAKNWEEKYKEGLLFLRFANRVAEMQLDAGQRFYLEHPWTVTSWGLAEMRRLMEDPRAKPIALDQRAYGQKDPSGEGLLKKPTAILTTLDYAEDLEKRCTKDHDHTAVFGSQRGPEGKLEKISKWSQIYPPNLARAIRKVINENLERPVEELNVVMALCDASATRPGGETWETVAKRIHANLGRADPRWTAFALKMAKAKPELLEAMKRVIESCDVCDAAKRPRSPPPARSPTPETFEFNEVIGMGLLFGGQDLG